MSYTWKPYTKVTNRGTTEFQSIITFFSVRDIAKHVYIFWKLNASTKWKFWNFSAQKGLKRYFEIFAQKGQKR